ncbi:hypothetical protein [Corynebacterium phocae]|uniref:hypothetical protein n=1 Tax=Corynebacterium phocae TaxID=161895 RepID=UPI000950EFF9|nr:hypothetical protein [Corynebacterium phocae]KAA8722389.1 hypothetical protein F4V58_09000 [Corynebacterium phocae]
MFEIVPGFSYISVLIPQDPIVYARTPDHRAQLVRAEVRRLTQVVLEVAARQQPQVRLQKDYFDHCIRLHLRAWLRQRSRATQNLVVHSLHAQSSGEFHGSASIGDARLAFTGVCKKGRLTAFRLL